MTIDIQYNVNHIYKPALCLQGKIRQHRSFHLQAPASLLLPDKEKMEGEKNILKVLPFGWNYSFFALENSASLCKECPTSLALKK